MDTDTDCPGYWKEVFEVYPTSKQICLKETNGTKRGYVF